MTTLDHFSLDSDVTEETPELPSFENQPVFLSTAKLSTAKLELDDASYPIDALVNLAVEVRVTGVNHVVDQVTGTLARVHTFKVVQADVVPPHISFDLGQ